MKNHFRCVFLLVFCILAGCANLSGPRDVEVPLSKLQAGLDRRFPINRPVLGLFDIALTRPQLSVVPDSERIALRMDAALAGSWRGSLAFSGRLYVDPARAGVFMAEPQVDQFAFDGVSGTVQQQLTRMANHLMAQLVTDIALYQFQPGDLRYGGVQFVPVRLATTPRGLVVTVDPAK